MEPNRNSLQKPRGGRSNRFRARLLQKRIAKIAESFDGDTQRVRAQLILDLQSLLEVAKEQVLSTRGRKTKEQQDWARLAAYISQVLNGIGKTYDITQIKTELQQLKQKIEEINKNEHS